LSADFEFLGHLFLITLSLTGPVSKGKIRKAVFNSLFNFDSVGVAIAGVTVLINSGYDYFVVPASTRQAPAIPCL
jgi:hypothetical protein